MVTSSDTIALRAIRTLRCLRPLRLLSRVDALRNVITALFRSVPGLMNVGLILLLFWLIFRSVGVRISVSFADVITVAFWECSCLADGSRDAWMQRCGSMMHELLRTRRRVSTRRARHGTPPRPTLTTSALRLSRCCRCVQSAILSVAHWLQLATTNGWLDIMTNTIDARGIDEQVHIVCADVSVHCA